MIKQDEELDKFEEDIRKLKNKYDQFFAGIQKAPPIQERLLFLEGAAGAIHERALRRVAQSVNWEEQQRRFEELVSAAGR